MLFSIENLSQAKCSGHFDIRQGDFSPQLKSQKHQALRPLLPTLIMHLFIEEI